MKKFILASVFFMYFSPAFAQDEIICRTYNELDAFLEGYSDEEFENLFLNNTAPSPSDFSLSPDVENYINNLEEEENLAVAFVFSALIYKHYPELFVKFLKMNRSENDNEFVRAGENIAEEILFGFTKQISNRLEENCT